MVYEAENNAFVVIRKRTETREIRVPVDRVENTG